MPGPYIPAAQVHQPELAADERAEGGAPSPVTKATSCHGSRSCGDAGAPRRLVLTARAPAGHEQVGALA